MVRFALALALACSGPKPRAAEDAPVARDVPLAEAAAAPNGVSGGNGDLQIRVEWKDVPISMRASPGRTACKTARAPAVAPTTTFGIPDVIVVVEGGMVPATRRRIVLADCALTPRVIAATDVIVESALDRPAKITFAKRGDLAALGTLDKANPISIMLPIAGHAVKLPLESSGIYELTSDGETAWVIAATPPRSTAGVTEADGQLIVRDLAAGSYSVTAWLPPRAGGDARLANGTAKVVGGELTAFVLELE